jgi:hypothetical protein
MKNFLYWEGIKIASLVQKLQSFYWRGRFCLMVELHRDGSTPAACAARLFFFGGGTNLWSLCYQRSLPYLVFLIDNRNVFINTPRKPLWYRMIMLNIMYIFFNYISACLLRPKLGKDYFKMDMPLRSVNTLLKYVMHTPLTSTGTISWYMTWVGCCTDVFQW